MEVLAALEVLLAAYYQQGQAGFKASLTWGLEKPMVGAESDQHGRRNPPALTPLQGTQSLSRELRASALCPGLDPDTPASLEGNT